MDERSGTAQLGGSASDAGAPGVIATVSRAEVESALRGDAPVDLLLDIQRLEEDSGSDTQRVALAWEPADLEQLLAATSGEEIQLTFDEEELRLLLDPDVEAHGLREKIAVVTAVAGLAAAGAGPATAAIYGGSEGGTPAAATQQVAPAEITTGLAATADTSAAAVTASEVSTGLTPAADTAPARTSEISTGLTPATPSAVSVRIAPAPVRASEISAGIAPGPAAVETSGGGSGTNISWPSPAEAALAGGVMLAIVAASFAARTHRRPPAAT